MLHSHVMNFTVARLQPHSDIYLYVYPVGNLPLFLCDRSATSLGPVCDQDRVMEFGLDQLQTGLRPSSSRFELSLHVDIARTCSNLVADRFEDKIHYAILVADRSEVVTDWSKASASSLLAS